MPRPQAPRDADLRRGPSRRINTVRTYCYGTGDELRVIPVKDGKTDPDALRELLTAGDVSGVCIQQPNFFGQLEDAEALGEIIHAAGALYILSCNPIALGILKTPKECGADIAVGECQPLGMPLGWGGPYLGFMASTSKHMRKLPGRIVGQTVDSHGERCFVLSLQAREQHIRREKASSNICSNEALCALTAGVYLRSEDGRRIEKLTEPVYDPMTRSNDGKCDPQGRFWCGTSDLVKGEKRGKLYLLPGDGRCIEMLDRLEISNGLGFAGDTLYFIDSARHSVDSYRLDEDTLTLHDHRVIAPIEGNMVPDGMTMDEEGMLWVCHWGGGFVGRYDPRDGRLLARVEIPASQCSSCCFGGPDMQTLFITCGAVNCPEESEAGKVFAVHLPYRGVESWKYRG